MFRATGGARLGGFQNRSAINGRTHMEINVVTANMMDRIHTARQAGLHEPSEEVENGRVGPG